MVAYGRQLVFSAQALARFRSKRFFFPENLFQRFVLVCSPHHALLNQRGNGIEKLNEKRENSAPPTRPPTPWCHELMLQHRLPSSSRINLSSLGHSISSRFLARSRLRLELVADRFDACDQGASEDTHIIMLDVHPGSCEAMHIIRIFSSHYQSPRHTTRHCPA